MAETAFLSTPPKFHSPAAGATVTLDPTIALNFTWVPGEAESVVATSGGFPGQEMVVIIQTSGTSSYTLTFSSSWFHTTSTLATGTTSARFFVLKFVSMNGAWYEISRTAAMA